ncbi:MAG: hypothetical protein EOQ28_03025 [Mesorhizobium sp.]|uniref:hypothetical protein n=1 Tax=Mesorhizobium sp. TaxID=1871066 RepID=UPI000FE66D95|nr:hypothetical protein [Mesorhizobium sp.]RWA76673.1 MAG: hypothetical protein EOQ28_03025 [Mesorhizobium sp.]RWC05067.1 MAG: hypothetical protein EOQ57_05645 [Mesorhizobium sp.]
MLSQSDFDDFCPHCGITIDRDKVGARRVFCSLECQRSDFHQLEKDARLEAKKDRPPCRRCGEPVAIRKDRRAVYCSKACQVAEFLDGKKKARLALRANRPPCRRCGEPVDVRKYPTAMWCSTTCRSAGDVPKVCENCGIAFKGKSRAKYCCLSCAALHRQELRRLRYDPS